MLRIASNVASLGAQRSFNINQRDTERALKELATGSRFVNPGSDPAGQAIAEGLAAQTRSSQAALNNTENAMGFVAVAEGSLAEQNNILIRLRELSVQAASDTLSDVERGYLDDEYQQLVSEFDRIAKSTTYGSQKLLDGSTKAYEFQVGANGGKENIIEYTSDTNTTASHMGISGLSVTDKSDARDSLEDLDDAMIEMGAARAKLGAIQSRMDSTVSHLQTQVENVGAAYARMAETNIPDAVSRVRRGQILAQYQAAAMAASNQMADSALRLIA